MQEPGTNRSSRRQISSLQPSLPTPLHATTCQSAASSSAFAHQSPPPGDYIPARSQYPSAAPCASAANWMAAVELSPLRRSVPATDALLFSSDDLDHRASTATAHLPLAPGAPDASACDSPAPTAAAAGDVGTDGHSMAAPIDRRGVRSQQAALKRGGAVRSVPTRGPEAAKTAADNGNSQETPPAKPAAKRKVGRPALGWSTIIGNTFKREFNKQAPSEGGTSSQTALTGAPALSSGQAGTAPLACQPQASPSSSAAGADAPASSAFLGALRGALGAIDSVAAPLPGTIMSLEDYALAPKAAPIKSRPRSGAAVAAGAGIRTAERRDGPRPPKRQKREGDVRPQQLHVAGSVQVTASDEPAGAAKTRAARARKENVDDSVLEHAQLLLSLRDSTW